MSTVDISVIAMPWASLETPSIQLGIVTAMLEKRGFRVKAHSLYLDACELFVQNAVIPLHLGLSHCQYIANRGWRVGLGDWIFATATFTGADSDRDEEYCRYLRDEGVPEEIIRTAFAIRRLVPDFLVHCINEIVKTKPALVGFTTSFSQNAASLALAQQLKHEHPEIVNVFGGANCDGSMGETIHTNFPWVDFVVRGEAEAVFPDLCEDLVAGREIEPRPGLCFRSQGKTVTIAQSNSQLTGANCWPSPDYVEFFHRIRNSHLCDDVLPDLKLPFESARGCWWGQKHHCTFCGLNGSSMPFRSKSAKTVFDELTEAARKYARVDFVAVDNILNVQYFTELLPMLKTARSQGADFTFFYELKANLRQEQVRALKQAGVLRIQPGIESLSTPILKLMKKGTTALQNIRTLKWAARYGIVVTWNIIYGFPGEPVEEYDVMADLVPSLCHLKPPALVRLDVQRFSPYFNSPETYGLRILGPASYYKFIYAIPTAELESLAYQFTYEYLNPREPEKEVSRLRAALIAWDKSFGRFGPKSLCYSRGPGFLRIRDLRPDLPNRDYLLKEIEAEIYLRCDGGATPQWIAKSLRDEGISDIPSATIKDFLDSLLGSRLMFREENTYLALAIPRNSLVE
jgi:ribosomal peptide maturation radical SAM protein 1